MGIQTRRPVMGIQTRRLVMGIQTRRPVMGKFHVVVTNKVKVGKCKPGMLREEFHSKKAFENSKFTSCLFVKGGTTDKNFKRCFNVEYCTGTQKELEV